MAPAVMADALRALQRRVAAGRPAGRVGHSIYLFELEPEGAAVKLSVVIPVYNEAQDDPRDRRAACARSRSRRRS